MDLDRWTLVNSSETAGNQAQYEQYQEDEEQDFSNWGSTRSYTPKSKDRCYNSNH